MDQVEYVPYVSLDPLNDPKSFTFRQKVIKENNSQIKKSFKIITHFKA